MADQYETREPQHWPGTPLPAVTYRRTVRVGLKRLAIITQAIALFLTALGFFGIAAISSPAYGVVLFIGCVLIAPALTFTCLI